MAAAGSILLLGATGQVGRELRRALAPLASVTTVGRGHVDLADADAIRRCVGDVRPCLIVNAAAYTAVDLAEQDAALALAVNGEAPGILAAEARRLGVGLVHYSTDYVFDGTAAAPYREDDAPSPINVYGRTKLAGEEAVRGSGCDHLIVRTSWVYSTHGHNFLLTIRRLAAERDELRIVADQTGAPTWARAIAEATAAAVARQWPAGEAGPSLAPVGGTYHLTAAGTTTWHGFATAVVARLGRKDPPRVVPIATSDFPTPAARPAYSVLDSGKAARTLGVRLAPWEELLDLCLS